MTPLLLLLAAQTATPAAIPSVPPAISRHVRPLFVSPMGEPFTAAKGGDALAVWFQQADRDRSGTLTKDEMTADAERFFATLDVNHDGEIDPDEIMRYETQIAPRNRRNLGLLSLSEPVATADTNFNRGVSLEEFRIAARSRFAALDLDHRGTLSLDLLQRIRPAPPAPGKRDMDAPGDHLDPNADTTG